MFAVSQPAVLGLEDDGPVPLQQHPVLDVTLNRAGQHQPLDVSADPFERGGVVTVRGRAPRPVR